MQYKNFQEFYQFYLSEHSNQTSRRLHATGSILVLFLAIGFLFTHKLWLLILIPICGYGFAWTGHLLFEKNKPATFQHPVLSFLSDYVMLKDMLIGKIKF